MEWVTVWEGCENVFWSILIVKTTHMQIFRPVQLVVLAIEGKTGFSFEHGIIDLDSSCSKKKKILSDRQVL